MSTFHERKAKRAIWYFLFVYGWKLRACSSCNGSGHYDHDGAPPCGACDGTGKERYKQDVVIFKHRSVGMTTIENVLIRGERHDIASR